MSEQAVKRPRGRPKGSKNKKRILSGEAVEKICDFHKFNPTEFLIHVANGTDKSEEWTPTDRLRAAGKLHDTIHGKRNQIGLPGDGAIIDGQFELVFEESGEDFTPPEEFSTALGITLQGESGSEVVESTYAG
jgi:hypothetical protein